MFLLSVCLSKECLAQTKKIQKKKHYWQCWRTDNSQLCIFYKNIILLPIYIYFFCMTLADSVGQLFYIFLLSFKGTQHKKKSIRLNINNKCSYSIWINFMLNLLSLRLFCCWLETRYLRGLVLSYTVKMSAQRRMSLKCLEGLHNADTHLYSQDINTKTGGHLAAKIR